MAIFPPAPLPWSRHTVFPTGSVPNRSPVPLPEVNCLLVCQGVETLVFRSYRHPVGCIEYPYPAGGFQIGIALEGVEFART